MNQEEITTELLNIEKQMQAVNVILNKTLMDKDGDLLKNQDSTNIEQKADMGKLKEGEAGNQNIYFSLDRKIPGFSLVKGLEEVMIMLDTPEARGDGQTSKLEIAKQALKSTGESKELGFIEDKFEQNDEKPHINSSEELRKHGSEQVVTSLQTTCNCQEANSKKLSLVLEEGTITNTSNTSHVHGAAAGQFLVSNVPAEQQSVLEQDFSSTDDHNIKPSCNMEPTSFSTNDFALNTSHGVPESNTTETRAPEPKTVAQKHVTIEAFNIPVSPPDPLLATKFENESRELSTNTTEDVFESHAASKSSTAPNSQSESHDWTLKISKHRSVASNIEPTSRCRTSNPFRVISVGGNSTSSRKSSTRNSNLNLSSNSRIQSPPPNSQEDHALIKLQRRHDYLTMKCVKLSKEIKYLDNLKSTGSQYVEDNRKLADAIDKLQYYLDRKTKEKYEVGLLLSRKLRKHINNGTTSQFWVWDK